MVNEKGRLIWITGLSGAGKTTIGKQLYQTIKAQKQNVVFLDGDMLREIYDDSGVTPEERRKIAFRTMRLCKLLTEQGIDVICCVIAMFHECREWNREHIGNYFEIYLRVEMEVLIQRDQKKLYSRALKKEISHVVGVDMEFEEPKNADIVINNNGDDSPEKVVAKIESRLKEWESKDETIT